MSFVSQADTSHSQRGFSEPGANIRTRPRSKSKSRYAVSNGTSNRAEKESRSLSVASEDPTWLHFHLRPLFPDYGLTDGSFETWIDPRNLTRTDHPAHESPCASPCFWGDPWGPHSFGRYDYWQEDLSVSWDNEEFDRFLSLLEANDTPAAPVQYPTYLWTIGHTGRKIEEPHTYEQPSYGNLENYRWQQALTCNHSVYREIRNRCKIQEEPSILSRDQAMYGTILEAANKLEHNHLYSLRTGIEVEWNTTRGQLSLQIWRCAAGKNKSWKRCPKSTVPRQTHHKGLRRYPSGFEHHFAKSPLWLPAAFLRSQAKKQSPRLGCVVTRQVPDLVPERARRYDPHVHDFEDAPVTPHERYHTTTIAHDTNIQESGPVVIEDISREPAGTFIRFTWKDNILTNGIGQLDRFLPNGLVFRTRWCINGFLRNESFADVYSLSKASFVRSSARTEVSLEAHVFLDEYHGNCTVYARRLKGRMHKSAACLDTFWYGGRHVFIMRIQRKPVQFILRNTEEEFPILVDQNKCNKQVALQRRPFRGKPSFVAVAGGGWLDVDLDHRPPPMPAGKSALEKEWEQIEKARLKKAERQRVKRQLQRDKKIAEKLQSIEEVVEKNRAPAKVVHNLKSDTQIASRQLCQST